jgi:hypothetical protein
MNEMIVYTIAFCIKYISLDVQLIYSTLPVFERLQTVTVQKRAEKRAGNRIVTGRSRDRRVT